MALKQFFIAVLCLILGLFPTQAQFPKSETPWDLKNPQQNGMFTFYDAPSRTSSSGKPLDIGDFNGDGCGDLAVSGSFATFGYLGSWRREAGHVRIVVDLCQIKGQIDMANPTQQMTNKVLTIYGAHSGDMAGTETYVADFNGDGFDDLLFGAQNNDGVSQDRPNAGAVYLVLGRSNFADMSDIDLQNPPGNVLVFYGAAAGDRFGLWVDGGDFNGDGLHDMLIGANQADGESDSRINAGEAWIIYGDRNLGEKYGSNVDMNQSPKTATRIIGVDYDDLFGSTATGGDLNNDGYDEAVVSASLWRESASIGGLAFGGGDGPDNRRFNSGETFVIFGRDDLPGEVIDLAANINADGSPKNKKLTVIYGVDPNDLLGEEIAVGDINGDGRKELALGAMVAAGFDNRSQGAGETWLIDTREPFAGTAIDLREKNPERAMVIYLDQSHGESGDVIRFADLNRDGFDDLFIGAPTYNPVGSDGISRVDAGMLTIIFGSASGLPNRHGIILLPSGLQAGLQVRYIMGADPFDQMSYGLALYDVDGDGYVDIAPNAMLGDGADNSQLNAGEIYVISGKAFLFP